MATEVARRFGPASAIDVPRDAGQLGQLLAGSGYFSDAREAAQAAVKVMAGAELGFPPIASMTGVYIVKGRVTLSANLMAAAVKKHPSYDYRVATHDAEACVIDFLQDGEIIGTSSFTMADAQAAGLASSDTYRKHPRNMLFARAMSNGAKWYCPDVFGGAVYTPDELGAEVDEGGAPILDGPVGQVVPPAEPLPDDILAELRTAYNHSPVNQKQFVMKLRAMNIAAPMRWSKIQAALTVDQAQQIITWLSSEADKAAAK